MRIPLLKTAAAVLVLTLTAGTAWQQGRRQGLAESAALRKSICADVHADTAAASRTAGPGSGAGTPTPAGGLPLPPADSPEFAVRVREVLADPFESRRLARLQTLLDQCAPDQFAAMVPLIRRNSLEGSMDSEADRALVMRNWGRRDGAGAMAFIDGHDWSAWHFPTQDRARREALTGWAMTDPQAALAWCCHPANNPGIDFSLQEAVIAGWADADPDSAARWMMTRGPAPLPHQAPLLIADAIRRRDGQAGLERWFDSLTADSMLLPTVACAVAEVTSRIQPARTAEWIESRKDRPWAADNNLTSSAAGELANHNPAAAMSWAERMGSVHALSAAMQTWCFRDVGAASEWLRANPSIAHYDEAVGCLINAISMEDLEAARTWAGTIGDPALRQATVERLSVPQAQWPPGIPGGGRAAGNPKLIRLSGSGRPPALSDEVSSQ